MSDQSLVLNQLMLSALTEYSVQCHLTVGYTVSCIALKLEQSHELNQHNHQR